MKQGSKILSKSLMRVTRNADIDADALYEIPDVTDAENDEKLTLIKFLYKKMPFLWHFFVLYLTCYDKSGCAIIDFDLLFVNNKMIWAITRF